MRPAHKLLLIGALAVLPSASALAQPPPGGGGGFNPAAFQKWRDQHKYTFQLRTMVTGGIMECERSKSTQLKPAQAKQILGVITPLTKKPKLKQDEAKAAIQSVQKIFDARQLSAVDKAIQASAARRGGGGGGGAGGGGGRPGGGPPGGGGPGGGGNRPAFDPVKMQNFNPFNPEKGTAMYDRNADRNKKLFAFLQGRAAGKMDTTLDIQPFGGGRGPGGGYPGGGAPGGAKPPAPKK
jgi:hypothetical protein